VRLAINLTLSLVMLAVCVWLVWPNPQARLEIDKSWKALDLVAFLPYVAAYVGLLALTHFFRTWRWNNLLRPIGAELPPGKLFAISSVGFMAILALPARLGEFVRPVLLRDKGKVSGSAVLGTVAVERVIDGLIISVMVFVCCMALQSSTYAQSWMMPTAWAALALFLGATTFLLFALKWPQATTRFAVRLTLLPRFAPRLAVRLEKMLLDLIRGFLVLRDGPNLVWFVGWSILYWATNGLGMWVLARGMGLDLTVIGAFTTMGIIAVGIMLPNSPGLVGQFQWLTTLSLSLFMPKVVAESDGLLYAMLLHGIQVVWYVGMGVISMYTSHVSFSDLFRKAPPEREVVAAREEAA
jgi:uncharacterized protein (TIRG00374 family)